MRLGWIQSRVPGVRFERAMLGGQVRFTFPAGAGGAGREPPIASLIEIFELEKTQVGVEFYSISGPTLENVFLNVVSANQVQEEDGQGRQSLWDRVCRRK